MIDNPLDFLLPDPPRQQDFWSWATVTAVSPLQIRLDNDPDPLAGSPMSLVDPQLLEEGSRVYVQLKASPHSSGQVGRRAVIIGPVPAADPTPAGTIVQFAGENSPAGWLMCRGQDVSRETYSTLYAVLGDSYGAGDGSTTFNVPDLRGRVVAGYDSTQTDFNTMGKTGGAKTHKLTTAQLPAHAHNFPDTKAHAFSWGGSGKTVYAPVAAATGNGSGNYIGTKQGKWNKTANAGSDSAHNNLQPYLALNYIIKI